MYRKLNDRNKHKTVYPERAEYSDKSFRLSLLLKIRTLANETHSFDKSFQTDTVRLQTNIHAHVTFK